MKMPNFLPNVQPWVLLGLLFLLSLGAFSVPAGEVAAAVVRHSGGRFTVHTDILIQAPVARVRTTLMQFENLPKVNPGIKKVEILERIDASRLRMRVESRVCMLLICRRYRWVQEVSILASGDIETRIDPEVSDFREGWVRYRLLPEGAETRLIVDAELVPDFWFPPLIGPLLIKNKLRNEALKTAARIEHLAGCGPDTDGEGSASSKSGGTGETTE